MSSGGRRPAIPSPAAPGAARPWGERVGLTLSDERLAARASRLVPGAVRLEGGVEPGARELDLVITDAAALAARRLARGAPVVMALPDADADERVSWLARGAAAVISTGDDDAALVAAVSAALGAGAAGPRLADFSSRCGAVRSFLDLVGRVAASDASLLITGETGVGKEHLARAIHAASPRAQGPFVVVNCGALPETLLESELFGHEEGAFTGARRQRRGMFEVAHGGTVLLDEIGDMPAHLQVKLLTVLQRHEVLRLGAERAVAIDVRVMSATNRDLGRDMEVGRFRRDLFYRLGVVPLRVPPLRERRDDLPELVGRALHDLRRDLARPDVEGLSREALRSLLRHDWPGNVRELLNVLQRAVLLCRGPRITTAELETPDAGPGHSAGVVDEALAPPAPAPLLAPLPVTLDRPLRVVREEAVARTERAYLSAMLDATRGRVGEAARRAGLSARQLNEKMRRHGLRKEDHRRRG